MKTKNKNFFKLIEKFIDGGVSVSKFCAEMKITRQTYYNWSNGRTFEMLKFQECALAHVGDPYGKLAGEVISLYNPILVPCVCQTAIGDSGKCPKHEGNHY